MGFCDGVPPATSRERVGEKSGGRGQIILILQMIRGDLKVEGGRIGPCHMPNSTCEDSSRDTFELEATAPGTFLPRELAQVMVVGSADKKCGWWSHSEFVASPKTWRVSEAAVPILGAREIVGGASLPSLTLPPLPPQPHPPTPHHPSKKKQKNV